MAGDDPLGGIGGAPVRGGRAGVLRAGDAGAGSGLGAARAGRLGAARTGGAGAAAVDGFVDDDLLGGGGGGAAGAEDTAGRPRWGIEGGLPSAGGLPICSSEATEVIMTQLSSPNGCCPAAFSLGIPPANRPPSCGGPPEADAPPGIAGAPPNPLPLPATPPFGASTAGALRSFVAAFFSCLPAWICFSSSLEAMLMIVVLGEKRAM